MVKRWLLGLGCALLLIGAAWVGTGSTGQPPAAAWRPVVAGVWRSPGLPAAYALVQDGAALVIDAPAGADLEQLRQAAGAKAELALLTHHHRDTCDRAGAWLALGLAVRAPKAAAEWLQPAGVAKYWAESLPLRSSRTAYLVLPAGLAAVDCTLDDGQSLAWRGWTVRVVATPGHSPDHLAFLARRGEGPSVLFCGDAFASPGKLWSPYTTDWDHWTDLGLKPAAQSLRKLAALRPEVVCPAHGAPVLTGAADALGKTAQAVEEVAFLKSYERFTKERLGQPPVYPFLAKEQAGSAGEKPWSRLSEHLFYTGNTFVLVSRDDRLLVVDPWGKRSVEQIAKLRADRKLGPVEVVLFSHAHYDHYDGVYDLPDRESFQVWALDLVAGPIGEPFHYRAPFLDARPVRFDRRLRDGETAAWRDFSLTFRHFPGQSFFTMAVETVIDGKRCLFTGDNFFHQDLYSGTGGWMGLNRSWPSLYARSARMVLELRPDWVLAEHGGAFAFDAEDFRRRVRWAEEGGRAADALSPSGDHRHDWDPHRVHVEPLVIRARAGQPVTARLVATNPLPRPRTLTVQVDRAFAAGPWSLELPAGGTVTRDITLNVPRDLPAGRTIVPLRVTEGDAEDPADVFLALEVSAS